MENTSNKFLLFIKNFGSSDSFLGAVFNLANSTIGSGNFLYLLIGVLGLPFILLQTGAILGNNIKYNYRDNFCNF
jgi:hypothetical protein